MESRDQRTFPDQFDGYVERGRSYARCIETRATCHLQGLGIARVGLELELLRIVNGSVHGHQLEVTA